MGKEGGIWKLSRAAEWVKAVRKARSSGPEPRTRRSGGLRKGEGGDFGPLSSPSVIETALIWGEKPGVRQAKPRQRKSGVRQRIKAADAIEKLRGFKGVERGDAG